MQPVLGGRDDARLALPVERVRRRRGRDLRGLGSSEPARREGAGDPGRSRATAEEPAPADAAVAGQEVTAAVSLESGSDSALTASVIFFVSAGSSAV